MEITINKTQRIVTIDEGTLPQITRDFVFSYGIRQILNDCHSSLVAKDWNEKENGDYNTAVNKAVDEKLAKLVAGDIVSRSGSSEPIDPVQRLILRIAREEVKTALKVKKGLTIKAFNAVQGEDGYDNLVASHIAKASERLTKEAKRQLSEVTKHEVELDI